MNLKKHLFLTACAGLAAIFVSCDKNDDTYTESWVGIATVNAPETSGEFPVGQGGYGLTFDEGQKMWPRAIDSRLTQIRTFDGQRMIVDFSYMSDSKDGYEHTICINNLRTILTKNIVVVDLSTTDTHLLANDRIRITDAWVGDGYVNIAFEYPASTGSTHYVNLIDDQRTPSENPVNGTYSLSLIHDANGDTGNNKASSLAAFPIPGDIGAIQKIELSANEKGSGYPLQKITIELSKVNPTDNSSLKFAEPGHQTL